MSTIKLCYWSYDILYNITAMYWLQFLNYSHFVMLFFILFCLASSQQNLEEASSSDDENENTASNHLYSERQRIKQEKTVAQQAKRDQLKRLHRAQVRLILIRSICDNVSLTVDNKKMWKSPLSVQRVIPPRNWGDLTLIQLCILDFSNVIRLNWSHSDIGTSDYVGVVTHKNMYPLFYRHFKSFGAQ